MKPEIDFQQRQSNCVNYPLSEFCREIVFKSQHVLSSAGEISISIAGASTVLVASQVKSKMFADFYEKHLSKQRHLVGFYRRVPINILTPNRINIILSKRKYFY